MKDKFLMFILGAVLVQDLHKAEYIWAIIMILLAILVLFQEKLTN